VVNINRHGFWPGTYTEWYVVWSEHGNAIIIITIIPITVTRYVHFIFLFREFHLNCCRISGSRSGSKDELLSSTDVSKKLFVSIFMRLRNVPPKKSVDFQWTVRRFISEDSCKSSNDPYTVYFIKALT
jgi:hypothetical protein